MQGRSSFACALVRCRPASVTYTILCFCLVRTHPPTSETGGALLRAGMYGKLSAALLMRAGIYTMTEHSIPGSLSLSYIMYACGHVYCILYVCAQAYAKTEHSIPRSLSLLSRPSSCKLPSSPGIKIAIPIMLPQAPATDCPT